MPIPGLNSSTQCDLLTLYDDIDLGSKWANVLMKQCSLIIRGVPWRSHEKSFTSITYEVDP